MHHLFSPSNCFWLQAQPPKALSLSCETRGGFTWLHSDILQTQIGRPTLNKQDPKIEEKGIFANFDMKHLFNSLKHGTKDGSSA